MAAFEYKAIDQRGKQRKGEIQADGPKQVRQRLKEMGLVPVNVKAISQKTTRQQTSLFSRERKISVADLSLLTRQLAVLVRSGMTLESSLQAVSEQTENSSVRKILVAVKARVSEGYTLAECMAEYPKVFDTLFCAMVAAGEKSGHLSEVLDRVAIYTEHRQKMRAKLLQAMLYPIILVCFSIGIVVFLLVTVVPKIIDQFVQTGQRLPLSTQTLISLSEWIQAWGGWVAAGMLVLAMGHRLALQKREYRLSWHKRLLSVPLLGKVILGLNTARFARILAMGSSSSIPILEGMKISRQVMTNEHIQAQVKQATERVREGVSLRLALSESGIFPPMMLHMIASGEQSGELEAMLVNAAQTLDDQFETTMNMVLGVITPIMIAVMAGVVLFIVTATLMPILEMNNLMAG